MTHRNATQPTAQHVAQETLVRTKRRVSLCLTVLTLGLYFGFLFVLAFDRTVLAAPAGGAMNVGLWAGFGIIVQAFVLTGLYVTWANLFHDPAVKRLADAQGS